MCCCFTLQACTRAACPILIIAYKKTLLALLSFATDQHCSVHTVISSLLSYTHIAAGCLADAKSRNAAIRSTILGGHLEAQMLLDCLSPFHREISIMTRASLCIEKQSSLQDGAPADAR